MKRPRKRLSSQEFSAFVVKLCISIAALLLAIVLETSPECNVILAGTLNIVAIAFFLSLLHDIFKWRNRK